MNVTSLLRNILSIICLLIWNAYAKCQSKQFQKPVEIQLTPYKTTMYADGKDQAIIRVKIIDSRGIEVSQASKTITFHIKGDGRIKDLKGAGEVISRSDSIWIALVKGNCDVIFTTGTKKSIIHFEATADSLYTGATDIQTVYHGTAHKVTNSKYLPKKVNAKILGADISYLPELEHQGVKFSDKGVGKDAIQILKEHGFNYIRLRIFNDPANAKGYSPGAGFCDLQHTKQMAKRVKAAGLKMLLDFHYSDYWADPGHEYKPAAWEGQDFKTLKKSLYNYTVQVIKALKDQGTTPDMVQIGNEINHGMVWPDGLISNPDSLAQLIYEGVKGVKHVDEKIPIMLHIALGGQNAESRFFLDNMALRNVPFDIIGLSYYPKWHGTLTDLKNNMADLAMRYKKKIMVAEYTQLKKEVNDIAFNVPGGMGLGTFIWEPLSTWEMIFDKNGHSNKLIDIYPVIAKQYHIK